MSDDFPNRQTIRLQGFDYSTQALYFVTICAHNRENMFGEIKNEEMVLNDSGKIVDDWWNKIPKHFPGVELNVCQIMPNHMHMIINIVGARLPRPGNKNPTLGQILAYFKYQSAKQIRLQISTKKCEMNDINNHAGGETPPLQNKYDYIKKIFQRNYYEHIIRNEPEYDKICYYIIHNPQMWDRDRNNLANIYVH